MAPIENDLTIGEKVEIVLFEDNPRDASRIEEMLEKLADFPYEPINVKTLNWGLSLLKECPFDVMLTDLSFQDSDGIGTFPEVHERNSRISIIIFTASNDEKLGFMLQRKMFRTI